MSFQKIDKEDTQIPQGRECILVYGFGGKDYLKLKSLCAMIGVRDIIQIDKDMLGENIQNILDGNITKSECKESAAERAIILNAFSGQRLHTFLENFKKTGLIRPLMATVTPVSVKWSVLELITELQRERQAIERSTQALHEKDEE